MYLFVYRDGTSKQVTDNLTLVDILAATQGALAVYRLGPKANRFQKLTKEADKLVWTPVPEAGVLCVSDSRLHQ